MGWKESFQQVLSRFAGSTDEPEVPVPDVPDADQEANSRALETKLGYSFRDRSLLVTALLHRSHVHVTHQGRRQSNERLEFLGDAVLGLVVNDILFREFPDLSEGDLTKMKSLLVCGARLSEVATTIDLGVHIKMSRSEAATGGRQRSSILADTTEALIGAIYLDGGLPAAQRMISKIVMQGSERVLARRSLRNYKSRLQELIQSQHKSPPRYKVLEVAGPDHDRMFKVAVTFSGEVLGVGEGRNKKTAEQNAACEALKKLEQSPETSDQNGE